MHRSFTGFAGKLPSSSVESFFSSCQLSLSPTKSQLLAIKRKDSINNEYFIGDHQILCSATVKDLGILLSSNMKWSCHTLLIVSSVFTCSFHSFKVFSRNILTLLKAYMMYVCPELEYNTLV